MDSSKGSDVGTDVKHDSSQTISDHGEIQRLKRKLLCRRLGIAVIFLAIFVIGLVVSLTLPVDYATLEEIYYNHTEPFENTTLPYGFDDYHM